MPQIFKALASISAWLLFVAGWAFLLSNTVVWFRVRFTEEGWQRRATWVAIGIASIILSNHR